MQKTDAVALAEPVTGQQFAEISDDTPEIGSEGDAIDSSDAEAEPAATPPKRGRGRPATVKDDANGTQPRKFKYFPPPPRKVVGNTKEFGHDLFLKYFRRVAGDPEFRTRVVCYVYRTFPVTEANPPGDFVDQETEKKTKYIDCTSQPFENDEDVWNRYGAGDYKMYLNDSEHPGRAKTQMVCYFSGTREWEKYPPLLDLRTVVATDPKNGSYVRYLQSKGLMPKPGTTEGEDEEMAGEALRDMVGTVKELTDKVIDMAHRPAVQQPVPIPQVTPRDRDASAAVDAAVSSLSKANDAGLTMMKSAFDTVAQIQAKAGDPIETLNKLVSTVRNIFPQQDTSGLERLLMESQRKTEALEAKLDQITDSIKDQRIKDLEAKLSLQAQQQQGQPPKDALTQAREFAQLQREMKEIFGVNGNPSSSSDDDEEKPGREPREPWYAKHAPMLIGAASFLVSGIASIVHNQAVARTGQGNPTPPPAPPPDMIPPGVQQVAAGLVGAPPMPEHQQSMSAQEQQIAGFIGAIRIPLERHLDDNATGHDFADWLIASFGANIYEQVKQQGAAQIFGAIQRYAPELFTKMQQIPQRSELFVQEFLEGPIEEEVN